MNIKLFTDYAGLSWIKGCFFVVSSYGFTVEKIPLEQHLFFQKCHSNASVWQTYCLLCLNDLDISRIESS